MATLGKTTTPTWPTFGWYNATARQVAILQTMPSPGGILNSVSFWAATQTPNTDFIWGIVWDSTGAILAQGSGVSTSGGVTGTGNVGSTQWYTDTLTTQPYVAAGTQLYIGWQPNSSSHSTSWAYNGGDNSPNAEWRSASGAPTTFAGHTLMNSAGVGAVAVYATYTPAGGYIRRSGLWVAGPPSIRRSGVDTPATGYVMRSGVWTPSS